MKFGKKGPHGAAVLLRSGCVADISMQILKEGIPHSRIQLYNPFACGSQPQKITPKP
jgi:hypothetical protein